MPQLFIIKSGFTIKVNSICGAGRDTWNLRHKFNSQGPALRTLGLRAAVSKSQEPISRVSGVRVPCLRVQGPSPHVLILDYAQIECGPFLSFCTRFRLLFVFCSIPTAFISSIPDLSRVREISFIIPLPEVSWATHF